MKNKLENIKKSNIKKYIFKNEDGKIKIKRRTKATEEGRRRVGIIELTQIHTATRQINKGVSES